MDKSFLHKMQKRAFDSLFGRDPRDRVRNPGNEIYELLDKAHLAFGSRHTEEARQLCERALFLSRRYGNFLGEAFSLRQLSPIYSAMGRYNQAKKCASRALDITHQLDEPTPALQSDALISIAIACREMGQLEEALHCLQDAMELLDNLRVNLIDDEDIKAWNADKATVWRAIGRIRLYQADYEGAIAVLSQSLEISSRTNSRRGTLEASLDQAFAYLLNGESGRAMMMLQLHVTGTYQDMGKVELESLLQGLDQRLSTYEDYHKHAYFIYNILRAIIASYIGETDKTYKSVSMEYFDNAWNLLEQARRNLSGHRSRISFMGIWAVMFRATVTLSVHQESYSRAFEWMERVRSRTFIDRLGILDQYKVSTGLGFLEDRWTVNPVSYQDLGVLLTL